MSACPCGCLTRLPWFDDPDCIRHLPDPVAVDWAAYNKQPPHAGPCDPAVCQEAA